MAVENLVFGTNVLPSENGSLNLGDASNKWKINGKTTGDAIEKDVDSSISDGSTSNNLPTSAAVASFVENKGYSTLTATVVGTTLVIG